VALGGARRRAAFAEDARARVAATAKAALDVLILAAMPMVARNAASIAATMPPQVDQQDLADAGYLALVIAAGKFDAKRGIALSAYARLAVRGAMFDLVRRRNWVEMKHLELKVEFIGSRTTGRLRRRCSMRRGSGTGGRGDGVSRRTASGWW